MTPFRVGLGYDIHQLVENCKLILGGVLIEHSHGLLGHSDADCLSHAIADAMMGAAGLPDIGHYFPDTDPQYKDMNSKLMLQKATAGLSDLNYSLVNIDATVIAQAPKLAPHIYAIKESLSSVLGITLEQIGIKATTNEEQDSVGNQKAIATHAVCLICKN